MYTTVLQCQHNRIDSLAYSVECNDVEQNKLDIDDDEGLRDSRVNTSRCYLSEEGEIK